MKLTVYQLEISAPALGPCATDDFGALYFHPELVNPEANSRAVRQRVLAFFHVEEDLVGFCPMSWARAIGLEPEQRLNLLESFLRRGIDAAKKGPKVCETVQASYPGDREHTDARLRAIAGGDN